MKKAIVILLKLTISVGILAYLIWTTTSGEGKENALSNLKDQEKNWEFLAGAWAFAAVAVLLTFVRWWRLVRALEIPCRFRDAIRISFWGYLFNFLPLGIVSGDLLKAVMLAHEHPTCKTKAAASVIVDRAIGLYILFVVASVAILLTGYLNFDLPAPIIHKICLATITLTVIGGVGIGVVLSPGVTDGKIAHWFESLPRVGHTIQKLIDAVRMYRRQPMVLFLSSLMTVGVHCSTAVSIYLIARGLPGTVPLLGLHFVIAPLSMVTQVIPLSIGPLELALDKLYMNLPTSVGAIAAGQGFVVALCYRLITILIAALGIKYYLGNRKEVTEAMHESELD
jgi:glycosyltransferase 2 family protein